MVRMRVAGRNVREGGRERERKWAEREHERGERERSPEEHPRFRERNRDPGDVAAGSATTTTGVAEGGKRVPPRGWVSYGQGSGAADSRLDATTSLSRFSVSGHGGQAHRQKMRSAAVCIAFVLTCTSGSLVAGIRFIDPQPGSNGDIGDKRLGLSEPTCDELRAMWRYTKRQSRAAKTTNGYSMYSYNPNIWPRTALPDRTKFSRGYTRGRHGGRPRSRAAGGAPIYGRMVHKAPAGSTWRSGMRGPSRVKAMEELTRQYGIVNKGPYSPNNNRPVNSFRFAGGLSPPKTQVPQSGSFEELKDLIKAERARELQKQHIIEEMEKVATFKGKDRLNEEQEPSRQQSRKQFSYHPTFLEMMTPKVNYDYNSRRYTPNISRAWSRSEPLSREYMSP